MANVDFFDRIQRIIGARSLLKHPFYQAWSKGGLPLDSLRQYAAQYYHFELAYPTFLSGLHHRCLDRGVRQLLLENLWDEEHGPDNHVELWLRFCDALGLARDTVQGRNPQPPTQRLVNTYGHLTAQAPVVAGAAALYAFESQVPEIAQVKLQGLRDHYGMQDERAVSFFTVHQTLDLEHSAGEREMVLTLARDQQEEERAALAAVEEATTALWQFLDGVYQG